MLILHLRLWRAALGCFEQASISPPIPVETGIHTSDRSGVEPLEAWTPACARVCGVERISVSVEDGGRC
ncbi:MAG: hypothetical protein CMK06_11390, partial [Ponticaulis sp.]|nr:hypothetical protein [Ponticaulis sp.]